MFKICCSYCYWLFSFFFFFFFFIVFLRNKALTINFRRRKFLFLSWKWTQREVKFEWQWVKLERDDNISITSGGISGILAINYDFFTLILWLFDLFHKFKLNLFSRKILLGEFSCSQLKNWINKNFSLNNIQSCDNVFTINKIEG